MFSRFGTTLLFIGACYGRSPIDSYLSLSEEGSFVRSILVCFLVLFAFSYPEYINYCYYTVTLFYYKLISI
jgi:hypothetical protein